MLIYSEMIETDGVSACVHSREYSRFYLFTNYSSSPKSGCPRALSPLTCKTAFDVPRSSCAVHGIAVRCLDYGKIRSTVELHFSPLARSSHVVTHGTTGVPIVHKPVHV